MSHPSPTVLLGAKVPSEMLPPEELEKWRLHARQAIYDEEVHPNVTGATAQRCCLQTMAAQQRYAKAKKQMEDSAPAPLEVRRRSTLLNIVSQELARTRAAEIMNRGRAQISEHHTMRYK